MTVARIARNPYAAAGLGAAATLAVQTIGPIAMASGWVAPGCSALLAAAAIGVLAHEGLIARRPDPTRVAPALTHADPKAWSLCRRPADWLGEIGALSVPDDEIEGFLRARLAGTLSPMPSPVSGRWESPLYGPVALLALAFAARAARRGGVPRSVGSDLLTGLGQAMAHEADQARNAALASLRNGIATHLGSDGAIANAYRLALGRHGTRESFLMGLLAEARLRAGVLASAEFVWLKGVDRPLWYALNNLGRQHFLVEGLAAVAHHRTETLTRRPFSEPKIDDAIESLTALCRDLRRRGFQPSDEVRDREMWV